jgi:nucleolar protein 56
MENQKKLKVHLVETPIGYFVFDDNERVIIYKNLKSVDKKILIENIEKLGYVVLEDEIGKRIYREKVRDLAKELNIAKDDESLNEILANFGIYFSKSRMRIEKEKFLIRVFDLLQSVEKNISPIRERFKEIIWLLKPGAKLKDEDVYNIIKEIENDITYDQKREEKQIILNIEKMLNQLMFAKELLNNYSRNEVRKIAPNLSYVAGEDVALMLLSHAGSLENLAKMASSTIQIIGSEKALFRHLKSRGKIKPPKHGIIYNCKYVKSAPKELRGKIARIVASKISLAAKIDFYSGRDEKERLKNELEKEIEKILKKKID